MDKEERKEKLNLLRRQEEKRRVLPLLCNSLSVIAEAKITESNFLLLEEIDEHIINLNSSDFDFNYLNISFLQTGVKELKEKLRVISNQLNQTNYFTLYQWSEVAVLKINTAFIIDRLETLIDADKDRFYIHDLKYQNGLWIDLYKEHWYIEGNSELKPIYELRVFGKEWMKKIAEVI